MKKEKILYSILEKFEQLIYRKTLYKNILGMHLFKLEAAWIYFMAFTQNRLG